LAIKFPFHEGKAIEALALIASVSPGLTPLFVSKILFYAEKWHLNRYGRPVIGDTYVAMPQGPVPSVVKDYIDQKWDWVHKPEGFDEAVAIQRQAGLLRLLPGQRGPNLDALSESDVECIAEAIAFCKDKSADELSLLTHREKAYVLAQANGPMDYEFFIDDDNPQHATVVARAKRVAAYGVL
jgi:uncharacterized phage-associated protein